MSKMEFGEVQNKRILYSCLDWGSGHVSRSIGIIRELLKANNTVFLFCTEQQRFIFASYNLSVNYMVGDKFQFRFKGDGNFSKEMLRNGFRFRKSIRMGQKLTEELVREHQIDLVLSDHDYGFYSKKTHSIFITHQVQLPPKSGRIAQRIHRTWISKFNEIWILDNENEQLAGELSQATTNSTYIGWFSRFSDVETTTVPGKTVGIISGPEPYAGQLFHWILENHGSECLTLISPKKYTEVPLSVAVISDWKLADAEIVTAETIISRNGYSTLMDLRFLKKKAILIPTPGQLEQEYLSGL